MQNVLIASNGVKTCLIIDGKPVSNVSSFSFNATTFNADLNVDFVIRPVYRELSKEEGLEAMSEILGYKLRTE